MASTVAYKYPVASATAPTAAQVYGLGRVTATVVFGDADLTAVITHNFGLSAQELLNLFPIVTINSGNVTNTVYPGFFVTRTTNTVTLTKPSAVGSGGTFEVSIDRPSTQVAGNIGNR